MIRGLILFIFMFLGSAWSINTVRDLIGGDELASVFISGAVDLSVLGVAIYLARSWWAERRFLTSIEGEAQRTDADTAPLHYQGLPLTHEVELCVFKATISIIFFTATYEESRPLRVDRDALWAHGLFCSLITLVFGWWGFPFGPIWSAKSLYQNLRGGRRYHGEGID